jgi:hypothetical protein
MHRVWLKALQVMPNQADYPCIQTHLGSISQAYIADNCMDVTLTVVTAPECLCPKSTQTPPLQGSPVDGVERGGMGAVDEVQWGEATSGVH